MPWSGDVGWRLALTVAIVRMLGCTSSGSPGAGDVVHAAAPRSNIRHLVLVIQENHSFDAYFGRWCTAPTGSVPSCNEGPRCCEAAPERDPSGASPLVLDDSANGAFDPDHTHACMVREINGGRMDGFVVGECGDPRSFAYASPTTVAGYIRLAEEGALADHYFQSIAGSSSANDVYFARAGFGFTESVVAPIASGSACVDPGIARREIVEPTVADLLDRAGVSWAFYAEGYQKLIGADGSCPPHDPACPAAIDTYPCSFDPGDVPFAYFTTVRDRNMRDLTRLARDLTTEDFPSVSYVKAIGFRSEHPGRGTTISAGMTFVQGIVDAVRASRHADDTLVLVTFDEGGGYFDHVPPPPHARFDDMPYGTRVPMLAVGRFARRGFVSHVAMEHSSVVKFVEWNWLGETGQLGTRDVEVNGIGSLLDPVATGARVPE